MDCYWFFTWRTYGMWLPGDHGFVGYYRTADGQRRFDNAPGELPTEPIPALARCARGTIQEDPILLTLNKAVLGLGQFQEAAGYQKWTNDTVAVMVDHDQVFYGVSGDPESADMLHDWKSYGKGLASALTVTEKPACLLGPVERDGCVTKYDSRAVYGEVPSNRCRA